MMRVAIDRVSGLYDLFGVLDNGAFAKMVLQVHDSIISEIPNDDWAIKYLVPRKKYLMENFPFRVRMKVDIKIGNRWGKGMKSIDEETIERWAAETNFYPKIAA